MPGNCIGIDIGGTKIRGVLWDGKRITREKEDRTRNDAPKFARQLRELVRSLEDRRPVLRIGIGAAGVVQGTKLMASPNIPALKNFDFQQLWPSRNLRVDNDARCFARGEVVFGAGKGAKRVFALTIGTGIGRAFARSGNVVKVKRLEYPERWEREYQRIRDSKSRAILAEFLAEKLAPLLSRFDPGVLVIGGGLGTKKNFYVRLEKELKNRGVKGTICRSKLKNAASLGAALLFDDTR
ncbi:MAG: ROK family protein [Candidatus Liptonbacteria bacterium]|nr:ROK family protein [Candidatus Liptonbacteria bacterium]